MIAGCSGSRVLDRVTDSLYRVKQPSCVRTMGWQQARGQGDDRRSEAPCDRVQLHGFVVTGSRIGLST